MKRWLTNLLRGWHRRRPGHCRTPARRRGRLCVEPLEERQALSASTVLPLVVLADTPPEYQPAHQRVFEQPYLQDPLLGPTVGARVFVDAPVLPGNGFDVV